ncbi:Protein CBG25662 [Caenorhabditis briggsae]|uniref:Protein CBG25662 n=1 Tax=Caenorhabditis briggsae TaxID=6238 RepID=B6ILK7_CAEBR|nr:Protein CBG25662 [Caenorhabditis briggsae]CAS00787.1 Protein CBG25662 [Caenorhabditis briggsae]
MWFLRSKVFGGSGDQERDRDDEDAPRRIMDALSYRRPVSDNLHRVHLVHLCFSMKCGYHVIEKRTQTLPSFLSRFSNSSRKYVVLRE